MANKKETRWNLAELGRYARYFLIFKNAVDRVVRSYAESCTEQVPVDENGQPNFELVAKQCNNLMIAKDRADELLDWYYVTYKTMAMNEKEPEVIKTPDDIQSEEVKTEYNPVEDDEAWEKWKKGLEESIDAGKNTKEKVMIDNLRDAIDGTYTDTDIELIKSRLPISEEVKDEGTDKAGEETV